MNKVMLYYYSYSPRLRVRLITEVTTVPLVGDFVQLPPDSIEEITKVKNREGINIFGLEFKVIQRQYVFFIQRWDLKLELAEPLQLIEAVRNDESTCRLRRKKGNGTVR